MGSAIIDGLTLVDTIGRFILAITVVTLLSAIGANLFVRARYAAVERELGDAEEGRGSDFSHRLLSRIIREAEEALRRSPEVNVQAIIEDAFHVQLRSPLLAERFVKSATGLVIILGLMGTFYGLTMSVGRLVHLVSMQSGAVGDVSRTMTGGLTQALMGMAVAFSNSLLGIVSAVILTVVSVFSNLSDRRVALMVRIETYVDRRLSTLAPARGETGFARAADHFGEAIVRLDAAVARFESALSSFAGATREFNVHVKAVAVDPRPPR